MPATQPAPALPTLTARIRFEPSVPFDNEIEMNEKVFAVSGMVQPPSGNLFRVQITFRMSERDDAASMVLQKSGTPATQPSVRIVGSAIQKESTTVLSALESAETTLTIPENQDVVATQSALSQWLIKIEKKTDQK